MKKYKSQHIFSSHKKAIDWMIAHPMKVVEWYSKTLYYDDEKTKFVSYEQEYDCTGIMCYDVKKTYSAAELLSGVQSHIDALRANEGDETWWLDEFGTLVYVYLHCSTVS